MNPPEVNNLKLFHSSKEVIVEYVRILSGQICNGSKEERYEDKVFKAISLTVSTIKLTPHQSHLGGIQQ